MNAMAAAAGGTISVAKLSDPAWGTIEIPTFRPSAETEEVSCPSFEGTVRGRWSPSMTMTLPKTELSPASTVRVWLNEQNYTRALWRTTDEPGRRCALSVEPVIGVKELIEKIHFELLGKPIDELWKALGDTPQNNGAGYWVHLLGAAWGWNTTSIRYTSDAGKLSEIHIEMTVAKETYSVLGFHLKKLAPAPTLSYDEATSELRIDVR